MSKEHRDALKRQLIRNEAGTEDYLDFQIRCVRKFGPAAGLFLHQLVYWVGKERDEEGWIYKTQSEMEKETGLSRWHQEKARDILLSQGVLQEKLKGLPRRLWYWVDLEALLNVMETPHSTLNQWARKQDDNAAETTNMKDSASLDGITNHTDEVDSTIPANEYVNTNLASEYSNNAPASEDSINGRAITESTSETTAGSSSANYSAENSNFQFGEDHASRGLSPHEDMKVADPLEPSMGELLQRIYNLLGSSDSAAYRAYERYLEGSLSLADLASEISFVLTGSRDRAELYIEPVRRMVDEFAMDDDSGEPPRDGRQNLVP